MPADYLVKCIECGRSFCRQKSDVHVVSCCLCKWVKSHGTSILMYREWVRRQRRIETYRRRAAAGLPLFEREET